MTAAAVTRPPAPPILASRAFLLVLASCALPNAILVSAINVALPAIQSAFEVSSATLAWAASGYITAGAIGAVVFGRAADVLGLRTAACACIVGIIGSSAVVAAAPAFAVLVAGRVLQGFFTMALPALALASAVRDVERSGRTRALGLVMAFFGVGLVAGSVVGGFLIAATSWRAPFLVSGVVAALLLVPASRALPARVRTKRIPFDVAGGLLVSVTIGATLLATNQLPRVGGTRLGAPALAVAVGGWLLFLGHIGRARAPFIEPVVLRHSSFLLVCALGAAMQAMFVSAGFVGSLALHDVHGRSVAQIGLLLSPGLLTVLATGVAGRRLGDALGERRVATLSVVVGVAGAVVVTVGGVEHEALLVVAYVLFAAAYTASQAVLMGVAGSLLPARAAATGMGFYNFSYFAAGALSVAVAGGTIERRLPVGDAWNPLHRGPGAGYVDAFAILLVFSVAAVSILLGLRHRGVLTR